jgi:hypothetical protein
MASALWNQIGDMKLQMADSQVGSRRVSNPGGGIGGGPNVNTKPGAGIAGGGPNANTKCGLCGNRELHKLFDAPGQKNLCPVKVITDTTKAKEAAKWILAEHQGDKAKDVKELATEAVAKFT